MHFVGTVDWSFTDHPTPASATSSGLSRLRIVGPDEGAVHTEAAVGALTPGGWLGRHIHSFEEALYVLAGELILEIDGHVHRLVPGDFAHMAVGTWHALANAGSEPVRWFSVNTPMRLDPASGRRDTFFRDGPLDVARHWLRRPPDPPSVTRPSAPSATTTARRRRPRPCASTIRPMVVPRSGPTSPSSPTAASP